MASLWIVPALSGNYPDLERLTRCVEFFGNTKSKTEMENILNSKMQNLPDEGKEAIQSDYYKFFDDIEPGHVIRRSYYRERVSALGQQTGILAF
jgi:hypothetical protein